MKVEATVILPAFVDLEVPDGTSLDVIRGLVLDQADLMLEGSGIEAIITQSNIPELVD